MAGQAAGERDQLVHGFEVAADTAEHRQALVAVAPPDEDMSINNFPAGQTGINAYQITLSVVDFGLDQAKARRVRRSGGSWASRIGNHPGESDGVLNRLCKMEA
ncbi:hypothetical protein GCM10009687_18240 [Asanoa iriomotensis]|uniref:Uncharacterized protein n=1 Tax=Asanoa iriomotensis TaxID=234613 RepID=A0ABQ4C604_9ACTN|nr:hypothetical protein Air01nite_42790 [Asanoa iriomotensis]